MLNDVIERLEAEVEALNYELNVTLPEALEKAIANGDLRENGDYHAALERQGFVSARLSQLRGRLVKISQIDTAKIPVDKIGLGSRVEVQDLDTDDVDEYELVIPDAMDLDLGHVTKASKQKIAYYPANVMPPPDAEEAFPADRKAGLEVAVKLETPAEAVLRKLND